MNFTSLYFLFFLLPLVLLLYLFSHNTRWKSILLFVFSLFFYAWGEPIYVLFLLLCILINYFSAKSMMQAYNNKKKQYFIFILCINVFELLYFKYYGILLDELSTILPWHFSYQTLPMPLGISFYMFTLLSYQIDVYRNRVETNPSFLSFALYIAFFPKLLMGPIMRYADWEKQTFTIKPVLFHKGARSFIIGLGQKAILSTTLASIFITLQQEPLSFLTAWMIVLTFSLQLYFDFQGYSLMAIGLSNMFGIEVPENFHYPYLSHNVSIFWKRWHITLGAWFKDYIYIPLGGNRKGNLITIRNLLIVWMLTGLWHGATLPFIIWGLYHGVIIILERFYFNKITCHFPVVLQILLTDILVMIGWVFFFSPSMIDASHYLMAMFHCSDISLISLQYIFQQYAVLFVICIIGCTPFPSRIHNYLKQHIQWYSYIEPLLLTIVFILTMIFLISGSYQSFLYSKF